MASINISEKDFQTVAGAAMDAKARGDMDDAVKLDKIARKINAALTAGGDSMRISQLMGMPRQPVKWEDMPSTIDF